MTEHIDVLIQPLKDMDLARTLFREYQAFLNEDLCFQDFETELATLPGKYQPPQGEILVATVHHAIAGIVARRPLDNGRCEMKRLYVRAQYKGLGIGRKLAQACVNNARQAGFQDIVLDTLLRLKEAVGLYQSMGFERCDAYTENPLNGVSFWRLAL